MESTFIPIILEDKSKNLYLDNDSNNIITIDEIEASSIDFKKANSTATFSSSQLYYLKGLVDGYNIIRDTALMKRGMYIMKEDLILDKIDKLSDKFDNKIDTVMAKIDGLSTRLIAVEIQNKQIIDNIKASKENKLRILQSFIAPVITVILGGLILALLKKFFNISF